ncbi:peptidoglycan-binding domain-containing protein [Caballeronia sp. CLC5]|uniref:peptidoglycan recognition protein family protein n=1 Tax=Caballeronia sp. CLC5 TaxID=2906764 RepID=UPI001F176584|nr:peptidoglycan-binding domain-containing protein [Caballeronia sp. CLC5]MCE4573814.1 N-acetylmuramoyl-L-alanine amidase [Caballeronia sp. CLC5]
MSFSLTWLPDALHAAGLKVAPVDGWENRGHGAMGVVQGVICHHTAGPLTGNMPSLRTLINGRGDLPGPLAQLGLGRDGTFYVIAAGRCFHAGKGVWLDVMDGNAHFIGIEAENTGLPNDSPWPDIQMRCYRAGVAAILKHLGKTTDACAGHKEYARPRGRKNDPDFDMGSFRAVVADLLRQNVPPVPQIPASETEGAGKIPRATLRRGSEGELVKEVQSAFALDVDGRFGAHTEAAVRKAQRAHGLIPDGIVGPLTWSVIDATVRA